MGGKERGTGPCEFIAAAQRGTEKVRRAMDNLKVSQTKKQTISRLPSKHDFAQVRQDDGRN
jgi:hypothetical protein